MPVGGRISARGLGRRTVGLGPGVPWRAKVLGSLVGVCGVARTRGKAPGGEHKGEVLASSSC